MLALSSPLFAMKTKAFLNIPYTETKNENKCLTYSHLLEPKTFPSYFGIMESGWRVIKEDL